MLCFLVEAQLYYGKRFNFGMTRAIQLVTIAYATPWRRLLLEDRELL